MTLCDTCVGRLSLEETTRSRLSPENRVLPEAFRALLATNNAPNDSERLYIEEFFSSLPSDIHLLESKIANLQETMTLLKQERKSLLQVQKSLKAECASHRQLLAPARRLPPELLGEIFLHLARNHGPVDDSYWYIGAVCKRWRYVALANHRLWTKLDIPIPGYRASSKADCHRISMALQRSGLHPLTVSVDYQRERARSMSAKGLRALSDTLRLISSTVHRWKVADLRTLGPEALSSCLKVSHAPLLEELSLSFLFGVLQATPISFRDCPRLHTLTLSLGIYPLDLPWHQITDLRLLHFSLDPQHRAEYLTRVRRCINLRRLTAPEPMDSIEDTIPHQSALITNPNLIYLKTRFPFLLDRLVLPQLQEAIIGPGSVEQSDKCALVSFVELLARSNSYSSLTSLVCCKTVFSSLAQDYVLLPVARLLVNLERLSFAVEGYYENEEPSVLGYDKETVEIISSLAKPAFLPRLQSFEVEIDHSTSLVFPYFGEVGWLLDTLNRRWNAAVRLREFKVEASGPELDARILREPGSSQYHEWILTNEEEAGLAALRQAGMDIVIDIYPPRKMDTKLIQPEFVSSELSDAT